jgi:hypothetical protein
MPIGTPYGAELPTHAPPEHFQPEHLQPGPEGACAFVLDRDTGSAAGQSRCGAPRRLGSVYCHEHHALCYLPSRSLAEQRKLREIDALAEAVGGRSGRPARQPPPRFMRRMNQISRTALRPKCSRNVLLDGADRGVNRGEAR